MLKKSIKLYRDLKSLFVALTTIDDNIGKNKSLLNEIHASVLLNSLASKKNLYDAFTVFSMLPSTIVHILNEILLNNRKHVVEFGSGISTLFIARLIHAYKLEVKFYTVDQSPEWQKKLGYILEEEGINNIVTFIAVPLKECEHKLVSQYEWYDSLALKHFFSPNEKVDLLIVDGPVASVVPHARYPAVPFMLPFLSDNRAIFLDDSSRDGEKLIIKEWEKLLDQNFTNKERYSYVTSNGDMNVLPIFCQFK